MLRAPHTITLAVSDFRYAQLTFYIRQGDIGQLAQERMRVHVPAWSAQRAQAGQQPDVGASAGGRSLRGAAL